ncbi:MAG TPA: phage holin family protein [Xanthobacteraceae bacterium]|nr:phage holin family protein [Hyphomicrobium sp.]HWW49911.1 phage holin family protein [Xanthobacteraceae bacterium]
MIHEHLKESVLPRALASVFADLADLIQKEMQLARAEVTENVSKRLRAGGWMIAAVLLGLIAALLVVQAAVFAVATLGIALHWSCLIVAAILAAAGALSYSVGRAGAQKDLMPARTMNQIKRDLVVAKEQLT